MSDKFGLPIEVKYVAVELFDKYVIFIKNFNTFHFGKQCFKVY